MRIGTIDLGEKPVILAPMEDVTDPSFRTLCKHFGADMMYTEFIASEGLVNNIERSTRKLKISDSERPIGIQLYGHQIDAMVQAAIIANEANPDVIDINFGCPVRKIAMRGAGAGMLRDIPKMLKMTEEIVKVSKIPVTVKTRLGWDEDSKFIVEIAEKLQDTGIQALTIHGRTRMQLYKGEADWTLIGEVKNNQRMKIPIIGNGDVTSPEIAKQKFDRYGVDAIMIGRASIGRPYIFREIKHFLKTGEILPQLSVNERVDLAKQHFNLSLEWKQKRGIFEIRKHFLHYFSGLPDFKELRLKLITSEEPDVTLSILEEIRNFYAPQGF